MKSEEEISLSDHAVLRCFQFGLDPQAVIDALGAAHFTQRSTYGDQTAHYVKVAERVFKVITAREGDRVSVITVVELFDTR